MKELTRPLYFPPKNEVMLYDDDGNLIQDGRWVYGWDAENRLISMETTSSAVAAGVERLRLKFTYDWQGRRVRKLVQRAISATSTTWTLVRDLRYVYDGWNLLAEFSVSSAGAWAPVRSYVWGNDISGSPEGAGGIGGLLVVRVHSSTGVTNYLPCYDGNGNVVAYYHHGSKSVTATMEYDAFGRELTIDNGTLGQGSYTTPPFRFSTKYTDPETALVYYGFRYYSAEMGRWLNRDPIEEQGGINLYGMCGNDAVNEIDFLGMATLDFKPHRAANGTCGVSRVEREWQVPGKHKSGYIIQKVTFVQDFQKCDGTPAGQPQFKTPGYKYTEAWLVGQNALRPLRYALDIFQIGFSLEPTECTRGTAKITGEAQFFETSRPLPVIFGVGNVPMAGQAAAAIGHHTPFIANANDGTTASNVITFSLSVRWNCCANAEEGYERETVVVEPDSAAWWDLW